MQQGQSVATEETKDLISSDKVEGTTVYNRQGEKLGSIYNLMIDKISAGGYVVDLDRSLLERAPTYGRNETPNWGDRRWGQEVHDYYGVRPYWV